MDNATSYRIGFLLVTASAIAWSTAGLFTRLITTDVATMLYWRGLFGAAGLVVLSLILDRGRSFARLRRMGGPGWLFAIVSAVGMLCFIVSLRTTSVAHVSIVYAAVPLVAAGLGWLVLKERPSFGAILASLVALTGVAIMVGFGSDGALLGDLLALGMTLCMAGMMVIGRKHPGIPMLPAAALSAVLSALAVLPLANPLAVSGPDWGWLIGFGIVNSALGLALFIAGAKRLPPVETALIGALDAPLAPVWVWLVFSETPAAATLIGGAIVFAAVLAHVLHSAARQNSPASA